MEEARIDIPQPSMARMGELFKNNYFVVPLYQRNYAWDRSQINDLWVDLLDLVQGKRGTHFFGQIVTYRNEHKDQEIIDGQQRLTTSTIFMAAVRDIADKIYNDNFKGVRDADLDVGDTLRDIRRDVDSSIKGFKGDQSSLTVQRNSKDPEKDIQVFFFDLTHGDLKARSEKTNSGPKTNMQNAYKDITQWINNNLKNYKRMDERISELQLIFESFFNNFYIVMVSAPSRRDAFTIFETLNSRGKDLSASDIIKNHVMSLMGEDKIEDGNDKWNLLTDKLDNDSDRITRFIRTYWASKKRIVPESKLYREISAEINNINDAQSFLGDLDRVVDLYTVLESPISPKAHYEFFTNKSVTEGIDILGRLNVKLYYPIVMAMYYKKYSDADILKAINKIISVFIRHRTIINNGTNNLEKGFSDVAHKIWNFELKNIDEINNEINDKMLPTNEAVKASFTVLEKSGGQRGQKKWTLNYLLSELYSTESDDFDEGIYSKVFGDDNYRPIQISTDVAIGDHKEFIGNWALLEKSLSKTEFNDLDDAIIRLSKSKLEGNRALAREIKENGWTQANVDKRQSEFATDATIIW